MEKLLKLIETNKLANQPVDDFSLVIDDKQVVHGAIFVVKIDKKTFKLFIPEPHFHAVIDGETKPLIKTIIKHPEVMLFM
ncbi:hypothetical protein ACFX5U_11105 [Sphingobacterium sp. SG20118]|uniref:hypothetical protein n=1 Tax=Sphingobacterium TaxID=28453 RepID=UPI0004F5A742|nr:MULTISPECIES: hypothetical protein [Sphingobacterium]AIM37345.1 hypothetical protein KO02_12060 [Sphingobacterium sp. ML3W]MDH5826564.1 hypothetical protein [Sphingobacterium faecium]